MQVELAWKVQGINLLKPMTSRKIKVSFPPAHSGYGVQIERPLSQLVIGHSLI